MVADSDDECFQQKYYLNTMISLKSNQILENTTGNPVRNA